MPLKVTGVLAVTAEPLIDDNVGIYTDMLWRVVSPGHWVEPRQTQSLGSSAIRAVLEHGRISGASHAAIDAAIWKGWMRFLQQKCNKRQV